MSKLTFLAPRTITLNPISENIADYKVTVKTTNTYTHVYINHNFKRK